MILLDNPLISKGIFRVLNVSDSQPTIGAPSAQLRFKIEVNWEASAKEKLHVFVK